MLSRPFSAWIFAIGITVSYTGTVYCQSYPNKPIRIVATQPGGGGDFLARLIAEGLAANLNQQVLVDNRGGSGIIAAEIVSKATPDAYTLLLFGSALWLLPFMRDDAPYDPIKDFSPITLASMAPNILVVHPSLPARSVQELVALAKRRPGDLNYASGPAGSPNHLSAELFKAMATVNIIRVAYKGTAMALSDLFSGQVQLMFGTPASLMPHVKFGRLRALAVTTAEPSTLAPGLPTVAASGLPGYRSVAIYGMFAPAATPPALINRLNQEIVRVLNNQKAKERLFNAGLEVVGSSPEELARTVKADMTRLGKVIKDAGIRAD